YSAAVSYLTLEPGEFWVRIDDSQVYNVFLKVKNPAEKESSREVCFLYDKVCSIFRGARAMGFSSEGWSWYSVKEAAYSSLLASEKLVVDPSINLVHSGAAGSIGCIGCSQHLREEVYDEDGNTTIENLFRVSISWCYSQWAAFKLNTVSQDIESIKLCLFIKKPSYNTDEFGNILFYHDTSNSWPPMSNSSADKLLLSCSCETTDYMEIDIDPRDINADGYYIIEYKPAFQEYNCIPAPLSSDDELYCCIRKCNVGFYHLEVELKEDE
ncbi:MAG: hypothetical protein KAU12_03805, partial [Candidatus Omnitrophica bacterium]|nr:hypothetical protein [Candidatus Omnitrophota bacterium]